MAAKKKHLTLFWLSETSVTLLCAHSLPTRSKTDAMCCTVWMIVCSLLFIIVKAQEGPCPQSYPSNCLCFPKPKWVKCENMQATTEFPRGIFNNDTKWLSLEKTGITNITKEYFTDLPELTELDMIEGNLGFIQEGTFQQLVYLTKVNLKDNRLVSFPTAVFGNLSKLESVFLDKNPFKVLPEGMFENSPLKILRLQHSKLNSTGLDSIGSGRVTKSISRLHLDYSNLPRLGKEQFSGLPNLREIGLLSSNVQYVHTDFLKETKVTMLDLYKNPIVKIDPDAMRGDQITDFSCRHCDLTTDKVFGSESFLPQMTALDRLDLGLNAITHIPKNAFQGLTKLKTLLLFYNNISTIEENPFTVPEDLTSFGIQNNPFKCDCHLAWFHKYALGEIDQDVLKDMMCASPGNLTGMKFTDLKTSQFCCGAVGSPSRVCGNEVSKGTTVRPTSGILFLQPTLLLLLFFSILMLL